MLKQNYLEVYINNAMGISIAYANVKEGRESVDIDIIAIDPSDVEALISGLHLCLEELESFGEL